MVNRLIFLTISTDNFGITLIEQLKKFDRCCHQSPDTIREDISNNDLLLKIKNIDHEKRKIVQDFIQCLVTLHADVKDIENENDIVLINRKCQKVLCSYKQDDLDTLDRILDETKKAQNYLMPSIKQAVANEDVKRIGKELFKLIF